MTRIKYVLMLVIRFVRRNLWSVVESLSFGYVDSSVCELRPWLECVVIIKDFTEYHHAASLRQEAAIDEGCQKILEDTRNTYDKDYWVSMAGGGGLDTMLQKGRTLYTAKENIK